MLAASALYHRVTWSPRVRLWMRLIDHAGIYLLIAGTYTPVGLLSLHGTLQRGLLGWSGGALRTIGQVRWVGAEVALRRDALWLGWVGVLALPRVAEKEEDHSRHSCCRRPFAYTLGRGRLRPPPARPGSARIRVPRALPRVHTRGGRMPVRRDRVLRGQCGRTPAEGWAFPSAPYRRKRGEHRGRGGGRRAPLGPARPGSPSKMATRCSATPPARCAATGSASPGRPREGARAAPVRPHARPHLSTSTSTPGAARGASPASRELGGSPGCKRCRRSRAGA